jgi:hypothetical protein
MYFPLKNASEGSEMVNTEIIITIIIIIIIIS